MSHYCIFKDINSLDLALHMEKTPPISSPQERVKSITIPGRNGNLTLSENAFDSFTRTAEFVVTDTSKLDQIAAHFKGEGWITFSDEPDKKYFARVANTIDFLWFARQWSRFSVWFECQPFKQLRTLAPIVLTASGTIMNPGTYYSEPIIHITGTAPIVLTVNGNPIIINQLPITLDSELQEAYFGTTLLNNKVSGALPVFETGLNTITLVGTATLTIEPKWRWF
ncbi:MAG: hypothetical protein ACYCYM_08225 [Saccharofermentanales bacterium]